MLTGDKISFREAVLLLFEYKQGNAVIPSSYLLSGKTISEYVFTDRIKFSEQELVQCQGEFPKQRIWGLFCI